MDVVTRNSPQRAPPLTCRERLSAWLGPLGGRRVPITLATIPATIVPLALFTGGIGLMRTVFAGPPEVFADSWWATIGRRLSAETAAERRDHCEHSVASALIRCLGAIASCAPGAVRGEQVAFARLLHIAQLQASRRSAFEE